VEQPKKVLMSPPSPAARRAFAITAIQAIACELAGLSDDLFKANAYEYADIKADVTRLGALWHRLEDVLTRMPRD
jgi:hypothetical protein